MHDLAADRRFCREILPQVSRTFAINIRMLPGRMRESVGTAYLLCRIADTLEDAWPGRPAEIRARFETLRGALDGRGDGFAGLASGARELPGDRPELTLVREAPRVGRVFASLPADDRPPIAEAVRVMAEGMSRYAARASERGAETPYLDDDRELEDYCWVVAGCVGVMLTRLQTSLESGAAPEARRRRLELAPVVGRALQLTNILLDWPHDVRRGRCYVPSAWLAEAGLRPADLVGRDRPGIAALRDRLESQARRALTAVPEYLSLVPARARRYRLFVLVPALWALRSIERARRDPEFPWGTERPKLSRAELWSSGAAALLGRGPIEELRHAAGAPPLPSPA